MTGGGSRVEVRDARNGNRMTEVVVQVQVLVLIVRVGCRRRRRRRHRARGGVILLEVLWVGGLLDRHGG